jgi:hypothetical protein
MYCRISYKRAIGALREPLVDEALGKIKIKKREKEDMHL